MLRNVALFTVLMLFWFGIPLAAYMFFMSINQFTFAYWQPLLLIVWLVFCVYKTVITIKENYTHPRLISEIK